MTGAEAQDVFERMNAPYEPNRPTLAEYNEARALLYRVNVVNVGGVPTYLAAFSDGEEQEMPGPVTQSYVSPSVAAAIERDEFNGAVANSAAYARLRSAPPLSSNLSPAQTQQNLNTFNATNPLNLILQQGQSLAKLAATSQTGTQSQATRGSQTPAPRTLIEQVQDRMSADYPGQTRFTADQFSFYWREVTGQVLPGPEEYGFEGPNRGETVDFATWYARAGNVITSGGAGGNGGGNGGATGGAGGGGGNGGAPSSGGAITTVLIMAIVLYLIL